MLTRSSSPPPSLSSEHQEPRRPAPANPNILRWASLWVVLTLSFVGCSKPPAKPAQSSADLVRARMDTIRKDGTPTSLEELNRAYAAPPHAEDATALLEQAFLVLTKDDPKSASFLPNNRKAVPLLLDAATRGKARFPVNLTLGQNTLLPHLTALKKCVQLLGAEAAHQAGLGQSEPAARAVLSALAIARTLETEPLLISQLVRVALEAVAADALEKAFNKRAFLEPDLVTLQQSFLDAERGPGMAGALIGERCMGLHLFQMTPDSMEKVLTSTGFSQSKLNLQPGELEKYVTSPRFKQDLEFYLEIMDGFIRQSREPFVSSLPELTRLAARADEGPGLGYLIATRFLPALGRIIDKHVGAVAQLRLARVAAAVERHRLAHQGAVPTKLAELVPAFLDSVPTDPFDDKPLRFEKSPGNGYLIYSIGRDLRDDGGRPEDKGKGDLTFDVRR